MCLKFIIHHKVFVSLGIMFKNNVLFYVNAVCSEPSCGLWWYCRTRACVCGVAPRRRGDVVATSQRRRSLLMA